LRFIEAVYAVEYAGLAGAVGADNSQYLSIPYIQAQVDKGSDTAKAEREVFNPQSSLQFSFHLQLSRLLNQEYGMLKKLIIAPPYNNTHIY